MYFNFFIQLLFSSESVMRLTVSYFERERERMKNCDKKKTMMKNNSRNNNLKKWIGTKNRRECYSCLSLSTPRTIIIDWRLFSIDSSRYQRRQEIFTDVILARQPASDEPVWPISINQSNFASILTLKKFIKNFPIIVTEMVIEDKTKTSTESVN